MPADLKDQMETMRAELIERLAEVDDALGEKFLAEEVPTVEDIKAAIRRATIGLKFVPVFCGSAYKNKGVQLLLDGVVDYLPNPNEKVNVALDRADGEKEVVLSTDPKAPLVALAFKLEESRFGQLTYMRLYQGTMRRGDFFYNVDKKVRPIAPPPASHVQAGCYRHRCPPSPPSHRRWLLVSLVAPALLSDVLCCVSACAGEVEDPSPGAHARQQHGGHRGGGGRRDPRHLRRRVRDGAHIHRRHHQLRHELHVRRLCWRTASCTSWLLAALTRTAAASTSSSLS